MTRPTNSELRALLAAATPGPWRSRALDDGRQIYNVCRVDESWPIASCSTGAGTLADAALIVAAVNSLAELVEENEAMREALEALVKRCSWVSQEVGLTSEERRVVDKARALVEKK